MGRVLIIGAGGVGAVVAHKCAQHPEIFSDILLASRTMDKCIKIQTEIPRKIEITQLNADNVNETVVLINKFKPELVINVALPYQNLPIMDACLKTGVNYMDTATSEDPKAAHYEYYWQWGYQDKFKDKGIMAVLGCGFDPGASNAYCAYAQKHLFDTIDTIDIVDCNAGNHHYPFATNFNPEINIREFIQFVRHFKDGKWIQTPPIFKEGSVHITFDYPQVGPKESYLLYHDELESLAINIKGLKRLRFWMTFSEDYLNHLRVLHNVGMTRIDPVLYEGKLIIPLRLLKSLLPDPASLAENYQGKTVIGTLITGKKNKKEQTKLIYNVCDHAECFKEVKSQAISYTAGAATVAAAICMMEKIWIGKGVYNVEQLDPDPFMENMNKYGLPWTIVDSKKLF
jgi:saccharopine dehydrogenase (NAD+, L-lysine-forming)